MAALETLLAGSILIAILTLLVITLYPLLILIAIWRIGSKVDNLGRIVSVISWSQHQPPMTAAVHPVAPLASPVATTPGQAGNLGTLPSGIFWLIVGVVTFGAFVWGSLFLF